MPAGSDPAGTPQLPELPWRARPYGVRIAALVLGALLIGTTLAIWFAFPATIQETFTWFQRGTVLFFGAVAVLAGYALSRSRVDATKEGLVVVNGFRTRRLEWTQVVTLSLKQGSPWASMDLDDGTTISVMGIQGSDGQRAIRDVRRLRALITARTRTDRDD